ncbi:MAG: hypothetical protein CM15mP46_4630 [Alphaproteobacteria bacterium]|nr:MAG: hypothetical protein CM15mP46_4630 [Alphaproteobacteria bacterium]
MRHLRLQAWQMDNAAHSALAYGRLAHRLLEILPSVPASRRGDVARPIMRQYDNLTDAAKDDILQRIEGIIEMPELAPLFSRQALAEVPINGRVHGVGVAGQIDRLYVGEDQIILADFKTGQRQDGPPPHGYVEQLALYDALLGQIYPDRQITSWLVWTQTQFIEDVTLAQRQQALQRLFADQSIK